MVIVSDVGLMDRSLLRPQSHNKGQYFNVQSHVIS